MVVFKGQADEAAFKVVNSARTQVLTDRNGPATLSAVVAGMVPGAEAASVAAVEWRSKLDLPDSVPIRTRIIFEKTEILFYCFALTCALLTRNFVPFLVNLCVCNVCFHSLSRKVSFLYRLYTERVLSCYV